MSDSEARVCVLVAEDDDIDRKALERYVKEKALPYDLEMATSMKETLSRLEDGTYKAVLLDHNLGDGTGLEVLSSKPQAPVIYLTGMSDISLAVEAMKQGAYDYLTKDQERCYLEILDSTIRNVLGRRKTEIALEHSQKQLSAIIDSQVDMIFESTPERQLRFMSPSSKECLGHEPNEMQDRDLADFVADDSRDKLVGSLEKLVTQREDVRFLETQWCHKDGSSRIMSLSARPFVNGGNRVRGIRGSIRDITELRRMQAQLRESKDLMRETNQKLVEVTAETNRLKNQMRGNADFNGLIGRHARMRDVYEKIRLAAPSDVAVHIAGPSGTGKEIVAHALHDLSPRRKHPFVVINCSAIPETLLEATLFGHAKGAYTGATGDAPGYLGRAAGGTLFLDEIGDLSPLIQVKLLRFLQEHQYERVGESTTRTVDVRIITATHQDLWSLVHSGEMREDFYYRICVFPIHLPKLSERKSDIPLLVDHFLDKLRKRTGKDIVAVSKDVMDAFTKHPWPGNVRELENVLEYAFIVNSSGTIEACDLPPHAAHPSPLTVEDGEDREEVLKRALEMTGWNRTKAARALGISRVTLWKRMKASGLIPEKDEKGTS